MTSRNAARVRRAYTIVWFRDPETTEVRVLNGREVSVHAKALGELLENARQPFYDAIVKKEIKLDHDGRIPELGVQNNLSGVLMIGRSALPGGRIDRDETPVDAAQRELMEEMDLVADKDDLIPLVTYGDKAFYMLDLTPEVTNNPPWMEDYIDGFKPNSDKRAVEVITPQQLIDQLEAPDQTDAVYIRETMHQLAHTIGKHLAAKLTEPVPSDEALDAFGAELTAYQLERKLQPHADAVHRFLYQ